jgi:hypothetical protein
MLIEFLKKKGHEGQRTALRGEIGFAVILSQ